MTGVSPWSVKGISTEERELAKQAARRAGVPIGQWLSRQIREAAELERASRGSSRGATGDQRAPEAAMPPSAYQATAGGAAYGQAAPSPTASAWRSALAMPPPAPEIPHPPPAAYAPPAPAAVAARAAPSVDPARVREVERRLDEVRDLEERIASLEKAERRLVALAAEIAALGSRIEAIEQRSEGQGNAVAREMRRLGAELEELRSRPAEIEAAASVATSTAPIERAVMRLADRLQRVEELTLPDERAGRGLLGRLFRR